MKNQIYKIIHFLFSKYSRQSLSSIEDVFNVNEIRTTKIKNEFFIDLGFYFNYN